MLNAKTVISSRSPYQDKQTLTEQEPHPQLEQSPEHEQEAQLLERKTSVSIQAFDADYPSWFCR